MTELLELTYHTTGIINIFLAVLIGYVFVVKDANFIRSRIFLKYSLFKLSFLVLIAGIIIFAAVNTMVISNPDFEVFHETGEIAYNVSIIVFITTVYILLNPWREKWGR